MEGYSSNSDDEKESLKRKVHKDKKLIGKNHCDDKKNRTLQTKYCDKDTEKNGEICAICLCNMDKDIGSPDMCDHSFCLECILEWAKTNNSCPKDRFTFLQVFVKRRLGGKIIKVITIEEVKPDDIPEDEDDITFCEICGRSDREDILLLCDECDSGYHLDCLTPQLATVPVDEWFCPECHNIGVSRNRAEADIDFNEVDTLIDDGAELIRGLSAHRIPRTLRVLPRTRESERVRARIARARISRAATNQSFNEQILTEETLISELATPSTSGVVRRKKRTKKRVVRRKTTNKKVRRKKTTKKTTKRSTTKGTNRKKRKVKITRKRRIKGKVKKSAKRLGRKGKFLKLRARKRALNAISTPKSRIAEVLGIKPNRNPWQLSLPIMKKTNTITKETFISSINSSRIQKLNAGVPSLSLLGSNSELDYVPECDIEADGGDGLFVGVTRNTTLCTNAMSRRKAAALLRSAPSNPRSTPSFVTSTSIDILDSIIENQSNLLKKFTGSDFSQVGKKVKPSETKAGIKQIANGESGSLEGRPEVSRESGESRVGGHGGRAADGCECSSEKDPTGAEAYSSYLRERRKSEPTTTYHLVKNISDSSKKNATRKDKNEEDVDLYSDVEPEAWDDLEPMSPEYDNEKSQEEKNDQDEEDMSTEDDLIIDDRIIPERKSTRQEKNWHCETSALPGIQDYDEFGFEEVSDTEVQDLDRSPRSSISLSDSNVEDTEVVNNAAKIVSPNVRMDVGMGLDGLEVETISDSEETCFEDEIIEEGEILCDVPSNLPLVRPRVNMQFKKPLEMVASSKEFDGDYEEGEIVDETAAKKEKREKAKEEVDKVVNQPLDEDLDDTANDNQVPSTSMTVPVADTAAVGEKSSPTKKIKDDAPKEPIKASQTNKKQDVSFKKISKNTKVRNYRENGKDYHSRRKESKDGDKEDKNMKEKYKRKFSPDKTHKEHNKRRRGRTKDKDREKKGDHKRKEMERYNVRQMITKKEEERKKKDEFGRDVSLRDVRSRSKTPSKKRGSRSRRKSRSRSRNTRRSSSRKSRRRKRKRSYSTSSSSSSSSSGTSSSFSSSTASTSSTSSSSPPRKRRDRRRDDSKINKRVEKKKEIVKSKDKSKEKTKVLVPPSDKKENKKDKLSDTDDINKVEKIRKRKRREKSPLQSKEVFQSGGSIMVSVNFSRNQSKEGKEKKKKEKEAKIDSAAGKLKPSVDDPDLNAFSWGTGGVESPASKRTPLQDEPMWSPDDINARNKGTSSPDMRDLDVIMVTPPPQEPILISDSEDECITRLPPDLGAKPVSPQIRNQGPKTPPEPSVKFTLSTKQNIKSITNPLGEEEEKQLTIPVRGPNTPPGPPPESDESGGRVKSPRMPHSREGTPLNSSPEPDVYDPFEPTKSPSPQTSPQSTREVSKETINISDSPSKEEWISYCPNNSPSTPPPPLPSEPPEPEEKPPEPQKSSEDESRPPPNIIPVINTISAPPPIAGTIVHPPTCISALFSNNPMPLTQSAAIVSQPVSTLQQILAGLPANMASILYPVMRPPVAQSILTPDLSKPPPGLLPSVSIPHNNAQKFIDKSGANQNGKPFNAREFIDTELGSPTSPDSSDASDIFEPPSPHRHDKKSPRKSKPTPAGHKKVERFDSLFGGDIRSQKSQKTPQKGKPNTPVKTPVKFSGKLAAELDEEIPSSAVAMQVKEKFLKKIQRQERVIEEVKLCLKPFYNNKTISKADYKEIMKKCVEKVCHNKSGEINPVKIRSLVEGYIKKVKYYRQKYGKARCPIRHL